MSNIANLPAAIAGVVQNGMLERRMYDALKPALNFRLLASRERHMGRQGESVTKTRDGLIAPDTQANTKLAPGGAPGAVTRSVEQFSYTIARYGKKIDIHLPSSFLAQANRFLSDTEKLGFQGRQSLNRFMRDAIYLAYGGGNSFTTAAAGAPVTALVVKDASGFEKVLVNGVPTDVSVTNPGSLSVAGAAAVQYTAVNLGTNTITLSVAQTWAQYDSVVRSDAAYVQRQAGRATDRLIVAGDTSTIKTFRDAAAYLRGHNVPGLNGQVGSDYGAFIDSDVENHLYADGEFHDAIHAQGVSGAIADGVVGRYAGILFMRQPKGEMPILAADAAYQTNIHRSLVFGSEICIEAFVPEPEFEREVTVAGIATAQHYKMPLDPEGVITLVLRAPQNELADTMTASWVANVDWAVPSDAKALTGVQRFKRAVVVHTAGPA
jgi:hypothetical protein